MKIDLNDVIGLIGLAGITYGSWLVYEPAAFIVPGALLLAASILNARTRALSGRSDRE